MEIIELMQYMIKLFNDIDNNLSAEREKLSQIDMELSDLDHYIEIHNLKAYEYAKIGRLRKTLREIRRDIKNNIEIIEVIKKFTDKYNNKFITKDIAQNIKEQEKIKEKQQNPSYTYRTNILESGGIKE